MWVFSRIGFYSAVKKPGLKSGKLEIRARCRGDLIRLLHATGTKTKIIENEGTDYPFRVRLNKSVWADFVCDQAMSIDYPNFKSTIDTNRFESYVQKNRRHKAYMGVWAAMLGLEETLPKRSKWSRSSMQDYESDLVHDDVPFPSRLEDFERTV